MNPRLFAGAVAALSVILGIFTVVVGRDASSVHSPEVLTQSATTSSSAAAFDDHTPMALEPATTTTAPAVTAPASAPSTTIASSTGTIAGNATTETTSAPTTTVPQTTTTAAGSFSSSYESSFTALINDHRASNGLAPLTRNGSLDAEARAWSQNMAEAGSIFHSDLSRFLPPWSTVGENVAVGGSVSSVFSALVSSSGHNANMLNPAFTAVGIGVFVDADGTLWTTHIFAG